MKKILLIYIVVFIAKTLEASRDQQKIANNTDFQEFIGVSSEADSTRRQFLSTLPQGHYVWVQALKSKHW